LDDELKKLFQKTHLTIKKVSSDIEDRFHFNTAISAVMELVNMLYGMDSDSDRPNNADVYRLAVESVILLMSPIIPHVAEELWETMGNKPGSLTSTPWPKYREDAMVSDTCLIVAQVNGKLRGKFYFFQFNRNKITPHRFDNRNLLDFMAVCDSLRVSVFRRR